MSTAPVIQTVEFAFVCDPQTGKCSPVPLPVRTPQKGDRYRHPRGGEYVVAKENTGCGITEYPMSPTGATTRVPDVEWRTARELVFDGWEFLGPKEQAATVEAVLASTDCPVCDGEGDVGEDEDGDVIRCTNCSGTGVDPDSPDRQPCPSCSAEQPAPEPASEAAREPRNYTIPGGPICCARCGSDELRIGNQPTSHEEPPVITCNVCGTQLKFKEWSSSGTGMWHLCEQCFPPEQPAPAEPEPRTPQEGDRYRHPVNLNEYRVGPESVLCFEGGSVAYCLHKVVTHYTGNDEEYRTAAELAFGGWERLEGEEQEKAESDAERPAAGRPEYICAGCAHGLDWVAVGDKQEMAQCGKCDRCGQKFVVFERSCFSEQPAPREESLMAARLRKLLKVEQ